MLKTMLIITLIISLVVILLFGLIVSRGISILKENGVNVKSKSFKVHLIVRTVMMSLIPILNVVMLLYSIYLYVFTDDDKFLKALNLDIYSLKRGDLSD